MSRLSRSGLQKLVLPMMRTTPDNCRVPIKTKIHPSLRADFATVPTGSSTIATSFEGEFGLFPERILMLISRLCKSSFITAPLALSIVVRSFLPTLADDSLTTPRVLPRLPAPTCAAPRMAPAAEPTTAPAVPTVSPIAPPYEPETPAAPSAPAATKAAAEPAQPQQPVGLVNLPMPKPNKNLLDNAKEEIPAPAVEFDDDTVPIVQAARPASQPAGSRGPAPMPFGMDIPIPAIGDAAYPKLIVRPAIMRAATNDRSNVSQVGFDDHVVSVAKCFRGRCPVGMASQKLIQANDEVSIDHDGCRYFFADETAREEFKLSPEKFVPVLGGDCIVTFARTGDRVTGNCVANHQGQQFWFADAQARADFKSDPEACLARVAWHKNFLGMK